MSFTEIQTFETIEGMGKAGRVLRQVLEDHEVSQYSLAMQMEIERTNVYRWCKEIRDPTAETLLEIVKALKALKPEAARDFVQRYLGEVVE